MTAAKRAMSILLSGAMLMGNLFSPMTAFAGEAVTEGNEGYEAPVVEEKPEQPVTEAPDYLVTLPYYEEAVFMVDESHVKKRDNQGGTVLSYKAGDDVKIRISERDGFELEEIRVLDEGGNARDYTWEREDMFVFLMPEEDLKVSVSFRELVKEEETVAANVADTKDTDETTGEEPAAPADESTETSEAASMAEDIFAGTDANESADDRPGAEETAVAETVDSPEEVTLFTNSSAWCVRCVSRSVSLRH